MEDNKYFKPELSDIHIGYEYEYRPWDWKNNRFLEFWKSGRYRKEKSLHKIEDKYIATDNLRVPYLTQEQIEGEGWVYDNNCHIGNEYKLNKYTLTDINEDTWIYIHDMEDDIIYYGECKSKNELRKIMQWLHITK